MVSALRPLRLVAAFLAFIVLFTTTGTAQTSKYSDRAWAAFTKLTPDRTATGQTAPQWIPSRPLAGETLPPANNPDSRIRPTTNTTQSEMSMAVSPIDNRVILGSANCSDFPVSVIYGTGAYWSTDGGLTWAGFDNPPSGNGNQGDPASVIDRNGTFFVGSIAPNDGQGVMRSFDGGTTWTYHQVSNPNGDLLDKNHMTVQDFPILSSNGIPFLFCRIKIGRSHFHETDGVEFIKTCPEVKVHAAIFVYRDPPIPFRRSQNYFLPEENFERRR